MEHHSSFSVVLGLKPKTKDSSREDEEFSTIDMPPAHKAAAEGDVSTLSDLLHDTPGLIAHYSKDGLTPLSQAVLCQKIESVQALLKAGANVDAQDNVGRTCLSIAAYQGWHQGVMCLLKSGAKQSLCDKSGRYPLHAATYHSDMSTLSLLLNSLTSKEVNFTDHEMMTAVHWAAFHDRPEHLMLLIQKGGDILARDVDGKMAIHWAAQNNSFQCAHRLTSLPGGLNTVNDVDLSGKSPTHYAAAAGAYNILTILARCEGCDLEMEDPDERTPLHWASAMGHARAVETLLELGVGAFPVDVDGGTPLEYAMQAQNKECIKVMEDHIGEKELKSRQDPSASGSRKDLRYHYKDHYAGPGAPVAVVMDRGISYGGYGVPDIEIQPPTTIMNSKSTSNRTVRTVPDFQPRMYSASASTDTDAFDLTEMTFTRDAHTGEDVYAYEEDEFNTAAKNKELILSAEALAIAIKENQVKRAEPSALESLIGSSLLTGAQIASPRGIPLDNVREESEASAGYNVWAKKKSKDPPVASANLDKKNKTSMNTPDLQRVSVQSFRSIPPIPTNPESLPSSREQSGSQVRSLASLDDD